MQRARPLLGLPGRLLLALICALAIAGVTRPAARADSAEKGPALPADTGIDPADAEIDSQIKTEAIDKAISLADAEIESQIKTEAIVRAISLAEAAIARDETELQRTPAQIAEHLERLAVSFYAAGNPRGRRRPSDSTSAH